jgi:hypothetical protein
MEKIQSFHAVFAVTKTAIFPEAFPSSVVIFYCQELHIFLATSVADEVEISRIPLFCSHIA